MSTVSVPLPTGFHWHEVGQNLVATVLGEARAAAALGSKPVLLPREQNVMDWTTSYAIVEPHSRSNAFELILNAHRVVGGLEVENRPVSAMSKQRFGALLNRLVLDGGPTPQATLSGDGGIEVRWRVDGVRVLATAEEDGSSYLYGIGSDGAELFESEVIAGESFPDAFMALVAQTLDRMGKRVRNRVVLS